MCSTAHDPVRGKTGRQTRAARPETGPRRSSVSLGQAFPSTPASRLAEGTSCRGADAHLPSWWSAWICLSSSLVRPVQRCGHWRPARARNLRPQEQPTIPGNGGELDSERPLCALMTSLIVLLMLPKQCRPLLAEPALQAGGPARRHRGDRTAGYNHLPERRPVRSADSCPMPPCMAVVASTILSDPHSSRR
jgi:hypothetical protein